MFIVQFYFLVLYICTISTREAHSCLTTEYLATKVLYLWIHHNLGHLLSLYNNMLIYFYFKFSRCFRASSQLSLLTNHPKWQNIISIAVGLSSGRNESVEADVEQCSRRMWKSKNKIIATFFRRELMPNYRSRWHFFPTNKKPLHAGFELGITVLKLTALNLPWSHMFKPD